VYSSDPMGRVTAYCYDEHNRLVRQVFNIHPTVYNGEFQFDSLVCDDGELKINHHTSIAGDDFVTTDYFYNDLGQLLWQIDPIGGATCYIYDNLGRLRREVTAVKVDPSNPLSTDCGTLPSNGVDQNMATDYSYD